MWKARSIRGLPPYQPQRVSLTNNLVLSGEFHAFHIHTTKKLKYLTYIVRNYGKEAG